MKAVESGPMTTGRYLALGDLRPYVDRYLQPSPDSYFPRRLPLDENHTPVRATLFAMIRTNAAGLTRTFSALRYLHDHAGAMPPDGRGWSVVRTELSFYSQHPKLWQGTNYLEYHDCWTAALAVQAKPKAATASAIEVNVTKFLREQADAGSARAKFDYGERLLAGRGTETNAILGWAYIQAAADLGHDDAQKRVAAHPGEH